MTCFNVTSGVSFATYAIGQPGAPATISRTRLIIVFQGVSLDLVKDDDIGDAFPHNGVRGHEAHHRGPTKIGERRNEFDTVRTATGTILASL